MTRAKILLVDDEPAFCQLAARWLTDLNYEVVTAGTLADALQSIETFAADLVLLDLSLPPQFDPQFTLASIKAFGARPVIIITGHAERELALEAVAQGAWDFIAKPIDPDMLAVVVKRAIAKQALTQELAQLKLRVAGGMGAQSYIGSSSSAQQIRSLIERIAPTDVRVLVSGPSGTGKEVISRLLHDLSLRSQQAFVSVHCGAIPAELLESELFGHTKGAFTGADKDKIGLLALADGGTLFLDEIGEMPLAMQVKLLRVLQEGTYFAVGGRVQQSIDVRVVSATNADLPEKVALGEFREDLYYRIKGINIETKSLNERSEDVALLVPYFMQLLQAERQQVYTLAPRVLTWLRQRSWPGNVRELKNVLESVAAISPNGHIDMADIQLLYPPAVPLNSDSENNTSVDSMSANNIADMDSPIGQVRLGLPMEEQIRRLEITLIQQALVKYQDNRTQAARELGLSRQGLLKKIDRYGL